MSSETRSIVLWAARTSSPSAGGSAGPRAATSSASAPDPVEEPRSPLDARVAPLLVLLGGPHVEDVESQRVGAVARDRLVGRDDVPLRLRHLGAVAVDHPLREEPRERLAEAEEIHVVERLCEEPRVHQVQHRVLDPADVLLDGQPVVDDLLIPGRVVVPRVGVPQEVPGGVDERVHRVGLAPAVPAAARARRRRPIPRRRRAETSPSAGSRRSPAAARAARRREPARRRRRRSGSRGSGSPSSAAARAASRAAGSRSWPRRGRARRARR